MDQRDQQRARVQEDLRGLIAGDVRCDDVFLQLFAGDGGIYEIKPLAVVSVRTTADVVACVQYAAEKQIPVHARGAGSGVAGESLGPGLVLDFSKFMHRVIRVDQETVRVQPGVVCERLNTQLRPHRRIFGPNPINAATATIGGMIAIDAAGSRWLKYGSTGSQVQSLQVVLADGRLLELGREVLYGTRSNDPNSRKRELIEPLAAMLGAHAESIRENQPKCPRNRCGYNLDGVLSGGVEHQRMDMARLLAGSEGTLALITEATLATDPLPAHRGVVVLLFDSLEKASRAALEILPSGPTACDLMDRRHLSLAREIEVRFDLLIPPETEAALLVEWEGDQLAEVGDWLDQVVDTIWKKKHLAFGARQAVDPHETELFLRLADLSQSARYSRGSPSRPTPVVEDLVVPPKELPGFLVTLQNVLKRHEVTTSLYCHAGQGQLHIRPFVDLSNPRDLQRMRQLAEDLYQKVFDIGGTIGGAHAYGLSRTPFLPRQAGPLSDVFRRVKEIFDPAAILNPGKIVGDGSGFLTRHVRCGVSPAPTEEDEDSTLRSMTELQLNWDPAHVSDAAADCNRCGECRTQTPGVRMCPIFRFLPAEESSPRAKANLIAGVLGGSLELESLTSQEFKKVADLCVHCHMCRLECPAEVDIPRLMREGKGAHVAAAGLPVVDRVMIHLDKLSALGSLIAPAANWALNNRQVRWLMEKTLGIAQGCKLPRLTSRSFLRQAARHHLTRPVRGDGPKVVYFVDTFANYYDPQLGSALVAVLRHNGVAAYVHPYQKPAGMTSIVSGALDHARRLARHNVTLLAEAVRQGYQIVATEPSAALCLTHEYPQLLDGNNSLAEDAKIVAEASSEACTFLWKLHTMGKLQLDFEAIDATLGYHMPCHVRALQVGSPAENLLRLIPDLTVQPLQEGCSGMAGTFGLKRINYRNSRRAGRALIQRLRDKEIEVAVTECSCCKMQMEQRTAKPTLHPIKLLAMAYDLMPEMNRLPIAASRAEVVQ